MELKREIKKAVYDINYNQGRGAIYEDVVKSLPHEKSESVTRIMRKMAETGELNKNNGKFVLPKMEIRREPVKISEFIY